MEFAAAIRGVKLPVNFFGVEPSDTSTPAVTTNITPDQETKIQAHLKKRQEQKLKEHRGPS